MKHPALRMPRRGLAALGPAPRTREPADITRTAGACAEVGEPVARTAPMAPRPGRTLAAPGLAGARRSQFQHPHPPSPIPE